MSLSRRFGFVVGGTFGGAIGTSRATNFLSPQREELLRAKWREGVCAVGCAGHESPFSAKSIRFVGHVKLRA